MSGVQLREVSKRYANGGSAIDRVSFEAAVGELFVLAGASGAGKTTTLRLIAGLEEPTSGQVFIGGERMNGVPPAKRGVAMAFQSAALYPHLTVRGNLGFALRMRRMPQPEIERRLAAAADAWSIAPLLDRMPGELSGGERSRVALARAVVTEPRVLLLDEPLSGLDAPQRAQLREGISRLPSASSAALIYVTHDQQEAMALGDRLCVLDRGRVLQIGTPQEIYERPVSTQVAAFFGSGGMNLIPGTLSGGQFTAAHTGDGCSAAGWQLPALPRTAEGAVVLGIRPHALHPAVEGGPLVEGAVTRVEWLGHERAVYFLLGGRQQTAILPRDAGALQAGERVRLSFRPETVHLFSADDGRRLN